MLLAEAEQGMVAATSPTQTAAPVVAGVGAKTGESGAETGKQAPGVGTGLAKKVDKTLGVDIDGSELLGVTELQFAALEVQVLANQGDLLLAGQLIKNEGDEGKADDEAQKLIGETVKEIGVAQRKLQKGSDRLSIDAGGMVSGAGAEAGEKESEEKAGYQVHYSSRISFLLRVVRLYQDRSDGAESDVGTKSLN